MKTVIDIIKHENQLYKENVEIEFNKIKNDYNNQIISIEQKIKESKNNKIKKKENLEILENRYSNSIDKRNSYTVKKYLKVFIIMITFIISYIVFSNWFNDGGPWMGYGFWASVVSFIITIFVSSPIVGALNYLIPAEDESNFDLKSYLKNIEEEKVTLEKMSIELSNLENQLIELKFNEPKLNEVQEKYNSKDFLYKIKPTVLQGSITINENRQQNQVWKKSYLYIDSKNQNKVFDIDGNEYNVISIGSQIWMKENLKVSHFRNGDPLEKYPCSKSNNGEYVGTYYIHENNQSEIYGYLYNGWAIKDYRNLCPEGWHIPSYEEWQMLINFLGGPEIAGGKMKEKGTIHWKNPNEGATNESGFTGLPSGVFLSSDSILGLGESAKWWSVTERNPVLGGLYWSCGIFFSHNNAILSGNDNLHCLNSIRCIKD